MSNARSETCSHLFYDDFGEKEITMIWRSPTYDNDHVGIACLHTGRWRGVFVASEVFGVDYSKDSI